MNDPKYKVITGGRNRGRIANAETGEPIAHDEPIFILRAQDICATQTLRDYVKRCKNPEQRSAVNRRIREFAAFKRENPGRMKQPD